MKYIGAIVLTAGLVSAVSINPSVQTSVEAAPSVVEGGQNVNIGDPNSNGANSLANIFNGTAINGSQLNSADPNFDPANLNLGDSLGSGLNLGQIDFSDPNSIGSAILSMMNLLCAGNLFSLDNILNLGQNNELELFLQLLQLMQLEQLGFLNQFQVLSLISSGFGNSNQNIQNDQLFNIGLFKRAVDESRKTMKRTRLRRSVSKTRAKRQQCQQAGVIDPTAAVAPPVNVAPSASAAPSAAEPAAAPAAAAPASSDDGESLSDFTR